MATITMDYCGMTGSGRNVTAAKQDAARKLERLCADLERVPEVVRVGRVAALVYRDKHGWSSRLLTDEVGEIRGGPVYGGSVEESRDDAIARTRNHVCQIAWSHEVADDLQFGLDAGLSMREAREFAGYCDWQRKYRAAVDAGASDDEARQIAGGLA